MKYQWHLAFLLIFPNAAFCLLLDHQNCQSNAGAHFRQYEERVLNKVPFDTSNVMYYLECVMRCKSIGECLSLNARYEDDLIVCELLDGDSRNYSMKYQENSTYYEFTKGTDWKVTIIQGGMLNFLFEFKGGFPKQAMTICTSVRILLHRVSLKSAPDFKSPTFDFTADLQISSL